MANSSELLHFLKSDRHITAFSLRAQDILAETVHNAFKFLVEFFQAELEMCMPGILSESEDDDQATQGIMKVHKSIDICSFFKLLFPNSCMYLFYFLFFSGFDLCNGTFEKM